MLSVLKGKIQTGLRNKKILLTSLDSPFLDSQYVFPYLGILYLLSVAADIGMRVRYINTRQELIDKNTLAEYKIKNYWKSNPKDNH